MQANKKIIRMGGLEVIMLLDAPDTGAELVMFEFVIHPGAKVPVQHYHKEVDEALFVTEGTLTSYVDGKEISVDKGEALFIPRGAVHYHDNLTNEPVKILCTLTPGSIHGGYFREISELIVPGMPPDKEKMGAVMHKYGLIPA